MIFTETKYGVLFEKKHEQIQCTFIHFSIILLTTQTIDKNKVKFGK